MLHYLYKCDYSNGEGEDGPLALNASMYALGDKYDIEHLKDLAREYFSAFLESHALNDDFFNAVTIIYDTTLSSDRGLRNCITPEFRKHWSKLRVDEKFMDIVRSNCDIAIDLVDLCTASSDEGVTKKPPELSTSYWPLLPCPVYNTMERTELDMFGRSNQCSKCHVSHI